MTNDQGLMTKDRAPLIVVSGPSGVGKTTVVERLLDQTDLPLRRAVTVTTRPRRENEREEVDYHFWTPERFQSEIAAGRMLEHAVVFGKDYYGTPRSEVDEHLAAGRGVILVIDVQGAARVRALAPGCLCVFIAPPDLTELEARLRGRKDMTEERVVRRLNEARVEMARAGEFKHQIVNRDVPEAVRELEQLIRSHLTERGGERCSTN